MKPMPEAIWLVAHYAETAETNERMAKAIELYRETKLPIWVFASPTYHYPVSLEITLRNDLIAKGVAPEKVLCSHQVVSTPCLDTVQEMETILGTAQAKGIKALYCVSNQLQLWQIQALSKRHPVKLHFVPTPLREWRWWYLGTRIGLLPFAHLGIGPNFPLLRLVRHGRAKWSFLATLPIIRRNR